MSTIAPSVIADAYSKADAELRVRYSKIGNILAFVLMPAGISLDYFVYPDRIGEFFTVRLISAVVLGSILALHFSEIGRNHIRPLAISWALTVQFAIAFMIYRAQGVSSPYYAGLNMSILAVAVLSPWTFGETLFTCVVTLGAYLCACLLHGSISGHLGELFNNVYFIILTDIICVVSSFFTSRSRFDDFRLRHELDQRNKDLAEADRLKSEFFANISHEFRTPLTLIIAPIDEILRNDDVSGTARESLVLIRDNSLRLLKLISDLLELVRLQDGRSQIKRERINLDAFVPAMVDSVRHLAVMKGLKIKSNVLGTPLEVFGDSGRLEKVILNILTNALKFTPSGGTIEVRWSSKGANASIEFEDTGVGIPEKELPYVFDRFRQVDGSATRKHQGAGIGLTIAKELVQEQGGQLSACSTVGKGTTFTLELPLAALSQTQANPTPAPESPDDPISDIYRRSDRFLSVPTEVPATSETGSGEFTLLVIEDEPDMRRFLVSSLEKKFRVLQASDGRRGLELALARKPDLVLVDLMLPEMNGLDICQNLKSSDETRHIRVVLLTARGDERSRLSALERGADDFLTKPFSTLELTTRLENLLAASRLDRQLKTRNSDLERALTQLKETESQLIQSEKINAISGLSAGLLHEIFNPLNFMMMAIQLAKNSAPESDPKLKETLDDIENGMLRINDIVTDLRAFAYPEKNVKMRDVALADVIKSAKRLTSHEFKNIRLVEPQSNEVVFGSKTQLTQVFVNLILNAIWAVNKRKPADPEIRIEITPIGEKATIKVRDNGIGIDQAILPRIFDPFYTTKGVGEGMGLGLSVCHTIIKNHGSELIVKSEPGQWTEVSFDLAMSEAGVRQ